MLLPHSEDIKTIKVQDRLTPYLIAAYNGSHPHSEGDSITSYASLTKSGSGDLGEMDQKVLFTNFINQLSKFAAIARKRSLIVYAHNLSGFDGIFLLKQLLNVGIVEPIIYNSRLIAIKLTLPSLCGSDNGKIVHLSLPHGEGRFIFISTFIN